jgi:cell division protein FtsQ
MSLRPSLRTTIAWTLALAVVAGLGCGAVLSGWSPGRANPLDVTASLGFVVANIDVEGRETTDRDTIMSALGAHAGMPILAVSPSRAKEQLESLPWIRSAVIERRLPNTIYVRLSERKPLAVWQHEGNHELIDRDGTVIPVTDLSRFAKLPTIVGGDAARQGAAALIALLAKEPELAPRVSAAVLVGERRWNLRVDNTIDVLLPETDMEGAWARLAQLERTSQLLRRDVETVDLRLPDRLVMKVNEPAAAKDAAPAKKPRPMGKST